MNMQEKEYAAEYNSTFSFQKNHDNGVSGRDNEQSVQHMDIGLIAAISG